MCTDAVDIVAFVDEGLGHSSYLVTLGSETSVVIDPPRFPPPDVLAATELGAAFTADTHTHADYVSGSPELAARGAVFLAPSESELETPHRPVESGGEIEITGDVSLRAIATPGHTPDHLAYLLVEGGEPRALFSGGSLMVGTVGRTDLFGMDRAAEMARALYRTLVADILTLPDDLSVYPTHGAGSFCSAPGASARTTTIGRERRTNPLLLAPEEDAFVELLLSGLGSMPAYYARLPELNRRGPRLHAGVVPRLPQLTVDEMHRAIAGGAIVVDARDVHAFSAGHVPGALSIALRPVFSTWLGWLVDAERPIVFVLDDDQDRTELVRQCLTVGVEHLVGELDGGMRSWTSAGLPEARIELVDASAVAGAIVDVRQRAEFETGHVPGAHNIELGAIAPSAVPDAPLTLMCGHGERAMTAASLLHRHGRNDLRAAIGGPGDWATATNRPLAVAG